MNPPSQQGVRALAPLCLAALMAATMAVVAACDSRSSPESTAPTGRPSFVAHLPFEGGAAHTLVDDFNADGLPDIALTSRTFGWSQIFYQEQAREFAPTARSEQGFHPGELIALPSDDRQYLLFAEGANRLKVLSPAADGSLADRAAGKVSRPLTGATFDWPDWGLGLAIVPYRRAALLLVREFDVATAAGTAEVVVPLERSVSFLRQIAAADVEGDGHDELIAAEPITNTLVIIRYPGPDTEPQLERLYHFEPGGNARQVIPADVNQDGHVDLLVPDQMRKMSRGPSRPADGPLEFPAALNVFLNDGEGQFSRHETHLTDGPDGADRILDLDFALDQDGLGYAAALTPKNLVLIRYPAGWSADGPVVSRVAAALPQQRQVSSLTLHDLDGDGWLDLVLGRPASADPYGVTIVYGPLWGRISALTVEEVTPPGTPTGDY